METASAQVPVWLSTLVSLIFFGGLAVFAFLLYERRRKGFEQLAKELGLEFYEHGRSSVSFLEGSTLASSEFWHGTPQVVRLLEGKIGNVKVQLFELQYVTDQTKGKTRGYSLTVAAFEFADRTLPSFLLRPERWYHKIALAFGGQDIDFPDSPRFSSRCRLQGGDEKALREFFTLELRRFFENHPGRVVEGVGNHLFYFRPPRLLSYGAFRPGLVRALYDEGKNLLGLLQLCKE
ncbi:MAG: hypothetical protein V2A74_12825 [bacterium]